LLRQATRRLLRLRPLLLRTRTLLHRALLLQAIALLPRRAQPLLLRTLLLRPLLRLRAQASKLLPGTRQQKTGSWPVFCCPRITTAKQTDRDTQLSGPSGPSAMSRRRPRLPIAFIPIPRHSPASRIRAPATQR